MAKVLSMLPNRVSNVLEIGSRHGVMTRQLAQRFRSVTALDLIEPKLEIDRVQTTAGNVERLHFEDESFDCIICTEVLEHVPDFVSAGRELARVTRGYLLVSVPYCQDRRVGRMTCSQCGGINPPNGHLTSFDEARLANLFPGLTPVKVSYLAENRERTNAVAVWLQDMAGNPYGTYWQEEPCIYCGGKMQQPKKFAFHQRAAASVGVRLYDLQVRFNAPKATWIVMLLQKTAPGKLMLEACA